MVCFTLPLFIVMKAKSPKWVFPEKTHEPLNRGGTGDMEKRKGRPYFFQDWQSFIYGDMYRKPNKYFLQNDV